MSAKGFNVPQYHQLMRPTLEALKDLGGSASNDELFEWVAADLKLSEEALEATYPRAAGRTPNAGDYVFRDRMSWARTYLKGAGYIESSARGVWAITPEGRAATDEALKGVPTLVSNASRKRSEQKARQEPGEEAPPLDWKDELLAHLKEIPPAAFERLCQRVLREKGFTKVEVTGKSGDGGIDGHGVLRVNLLSFQVAFQAKRWKDSVGAPVVRDFRGASMGRCDKGLIITTGQFTAEARREAVRDGAMSIDLIDGENFCDLLAEIEVGVRVKMVPEMSLALTDFAEI